MIKLYGVIGNPIAQSMSPVMQNQEFQQFGLDAHYQPFHILEKELETAVKGMKVIGVEGFNVTSPHKTAIMPFLDKIDPLAEAIGAVNTVVRKNDEFHGYNTDGDGFIRALQADWKEDFMNERALIIGAGGAAKAIFYTLLSKGMAHIDICNRTAFKAKKLIEECPYEGKSKAISIAEAEDTLEHYNLIIQTTSIGMYPDIYKSPMSVKNLLPEAFVSDIIYNPFETALIKDAKQKGVKTQNGLGMFVYQGALAFEKWTGIAPDITRMTNIVVEQLGGNHANR
ncbi:shikimate dehydrogenase [Lederbergia citrea]|uniref:Shikimate dehydrogenase (NADP(+)) n=1 Tax=Lederbergia citrea TaxID=2833581 RepID=A0A942Z2G7_9BACI|nr:shikimate dehydrogenase [Lederbergia citrea]MBS4176264.1 shikimate dehydrogenase [Lederbergia citrea]MBS4202824.1 shikimate dehydrogenase [Lederbergia citrea]MBS4222508.1 shikimate dehydrogenase [Lederbergia citrea]